MKCQVRAIIKGIGIAGDGFIKATCCLFPGLLVHLAFLMSLHIAAVSVMY